MQIKSLFKVISSKSIVACARPTLLLALATLLGPAALGQHGGMGAAPQVQQVELGEPRATDLVIAETEWGPFTIEDLAQWTQWVRIPMTGRMDAEQASRLPDDVLDTATRWIMLRRAAVDQIDQGEAVAELAEQAEEQFEAMRDRIILQYVGTTEVQQKVTSPTETQITNYYNQNRPLFFQPFQFHMRHLILLTYAPYTVAEGDTLESIARSVNGDPSMAAEIRAELPGRPLRREADKEFKPLVEGETLLVPMNETEAAEVRRRLEGILARVKSGEMSFEDAAAEYSDSEVSNEIIGPIPSGTRPMLSELVEMAEATTEGEITPIFRTKHGFQVMQILRKLEEGQKPLSEVRAEIVRTLRNEQSQALLADLLDRLFAHPDLEIDFDKIAAGTDLDPQATVITFRETQIPWADLAQQWRAAGSPTDPEGILRAVRNLSSLMAPLIKAMVEDQLNDPESELYRRLAAQRAIVVGSAYLNALSARRSAEAVTDEMRKTFYENNKETLINGEQVAFRTIELRIAPEIVRGDAAERDAVLAEKSAELAAALANIENEKDFVALAETMNQPIVESGGRVFETTELVGIDRLPEDVTRRLLEMEPGKWSEPFALNNARVLTVMLTEHEPETPMTYEQALPEINRYMEQQLLMGVQNEIEQELLGDIDYQPVIIASDED